VGKIKYSFYLLFLVYMIFLEPAYSNDDISNLLRIDIGRITHKTYNNILPSIYITRNLDFLNPAVSSPSEVLQFRASGENRNIQCNNNYVTWIIPGTSLQNKIKCNIADVDKNLISVSFNFVYRDENSPHKQRPSASFADLLGTSFSNPSCESNLNATACKWEQKVEDSWFVFTQIKVDEQPILLGNRSDQAPEPVDNFCGEDSNKNGILDPWEFSLCLKDGNNSFFCTHDNVECAEITSNPICLFGGTFDSPNDRCKHPLISVTCPMPSPFVYNQGVEKCFRDPICPGGGLFKPQSNTCNISLTNADCPDGFFYDSEQSSCIMSSVCPVGTVFNNATKQCEGSPTDSCYSPYSQSGNLCRANFSCPSESSYNTNIKRCVKSAVKTCPSGTTLIDNVCRSTPLCPSGSTYSFINRRCEKSIIISEKEFTGRCYYTIKINESELREFGDHDEFYSGPIMPRGNGAYDAVFGKMNNCILNVVRKLIQGSSEWTTETHNLGPGEKITITIWTGWIGSYAARYDFYNHGQVLSCPSGSIEENGQCIHNCISGFHRVGSLCIANPTCPSGTTLNSTSGYCERSLSISCETGFTYSSVSDACIKTPDCPTMIENITGSFNEVTEQCEAIFSKTCPAGLYGNGTPPTLCFTEQVCSIGVYRSDSNSCAIAGSDFCPSGYPFHDSSNECIKPQPDCPHPAQYDSGLKKCVDPRDPIYACPTTYSYNPTFKDCSTYPICEGGAYRPLTKDCWDNSWACPYGQDRPCVPFQGKQQCSKFDCINLNSSTPIGTPDGANDKKDDGQIDDSGDCLGQIYIYNGQDNRCRSGGITLTGGSCCKEDDYAMGLLKCTPSEVSLMKVRNNGVCHEIGEYCSKEINLMFGKVCVEKSRRFCCFNSKLARIIHQQGRSQIDGLDWGTADSPNCRGFTPEEFEKLNFNEIDLAEFIKDIEVKEMDSSVIQDTLTDSFNKKDPGKWQDPIGAGSEKVDELYYSVPLPD